MEHRAINMPPESADCWFESNTKLFTIGPSSSEIGRPPEREVESGANPGGPPFSNAEGLNRMSYYIVDVEADGPIPGEYSMSAFGCWKVTPALDTFYVEPMIIPISEKFIPEAAEIYPIQRSVLIKAGVDAEIVMKDFAQWIKDTSKGRPVFISDNNGFDWQFINWYFHKFTGSNPFGFSSRRLGDIWSGMNKNMFASYKHLRKTKHTHYPLDDAKGNAECLLEFQRQGLKIDLE